MVAGGPKSWCSRSSSSASSRRSCSVIGRRGGRGGGTQRGRVLPWRRGLVGGMGFLCAFLSTRERTAPPATNCALVPFCGSAAPLDALQHLWRCEASRLGRLRTPERQPEAGLPPGPQPRLPLGAVVRHLAVAHP